MDFEDAKENIQPLAQGRNASILQASIKVESAQELQAQRKELEKKIHNYSGDDPLSVWYNYIDWIEQSFPSGGKESGLQEVLAKCLTKFENDDRYKQDCRMIKLYIKYIDNNNPAECYQQLFNAGIGTMVADFYIAWAYCYDMVNNTRRADEIFRRGIACRAQPLEELQEAHQHFGFTVAQRVMYKDNDDVQEETKRQMHERRLALSSLRGHRRKQIVGSVRTGAAVKSNCPGTVKPDFSQPTQQRNNVLVNVFKDENENPNVIPNEQPTTSASTDATTEGEAKSVVRSIIDAQRDQENRKEPGPWNKAHSKGKLFGKKATTNELGFEIHNDDADDKGDMDMDVEDDLALPILMRPEESKFDKPIRLPTNFFARNSPQADWLVPVTTEERPDRNSLAEYNKCKLYPRPNVEFQPEEWKAYCFLKKHGLENGFTKKRDIYWGRGPRFNIRQYPHFAKQSNPQQHEAVDDTFVPPPPNPGLVVSYNEIYNLEEKIERQFEEILALRVKRNETIMKPADMEETICATSEKIQRRKSFFPLRKSLAPCANRGSARKCSILPSLSDEVSTEGKEDAGKSERLSVLPIFENRDEIVLPKVLSNLQRQQEVKEIASKGAIPKNIATQGAVREAVDATRISDATRAETDTCKSLLEKTKDRFEYEPKSGATTSSDVVVKPAVEFVDKKSTEIQHPSTQAFEMPVFQFKTPSLPTAQPTKTNKLPFEIFEDNTNNALKPDLGCGNGGYFDADESCSTQKFNIFLKAQSVSTPKTKPEPQKMFANVLKEKLPEAIVEQSGMEPVFQSSDGANVAAEIGDENSPVAVTGFSPPRKQLSTILETSEHGTTQSTHTTGATTKSTISSPEFEQESHAQHQPTLDTVKERTVEDDNTNSRNSIKIVSQHEDSQQKAAAADFDAMVTKVPAAASGRLNFSIFEDTLDKQNVEHISRTEDKAASRAPLLAPPAASRHEAGTAGRLDFSIFDDSMQEKGKQQVGNFSRLEEKEDTAAGYAIKPVRFQEDKTETITKMMLAPSQPAKFQEDKTETISKMLLAPPQPIKFQEDKTETITKMLLAPPPPIRFEEDKTETITKLMLAPPPTSRCDDEVLPKLQDTVMESPNRDHIFEFFSQSPPKAKTMHTKQPDKAGQMRMASEAKTPIALNPKRLCDMETPDVMKPKSRSTALFPEPPKSKSVLRESFMPDFSVVEDSQPTPKSHISKNSKPKSVLRDSFMPDFSLIEDSQPQRTVEKQINKKSNFSYVTETQTAGNESMIPDSQPHHSTSSSNRNQQVSMKSAMQLLPNSFSSIQICNDSVIPDSQPVQSSSSSINRMKKQSTYSNNSGEGQPASMKNILTDSFMKDFSEINEPPPVPKDVKEMTMIQPCKNNSTLKFLAERNESASKAPVNNSMKSTASAAASTWGKMSLLAPMPAKTSMVKRKSSEEKYFELNAETEMFGTNISMIKNSTWLPNHDPMLKNISHIQEQSLHIKHEQLSEEASTSKILQGHEVSHRNTRSEVANVDQAKSCQTSILQQSSSRQIHSSAKSMVSELPKPKFSSLETSSSKEMLPLCRMSIDISPSEWAAIQAQKQHQPQSATNDSKQVTMKSMPEEETEDDYGEMSIYYRNTPKTPKIQNHIWEVPDDDPFKTPGNSQYRHPETDLNQTQIVIENICVDPHVNPFNVDLINAFLEHIQFTNYIQGLETCMMVRTIRCLKPSMKIRINDHEFEVLKLIGEGAYGAVFCGKEASTGKKVAMKQENPCNLWEYYICLEIHSRIMVEEMLPAYMSIDYALIGNNSNIFISQFSTYGSLITVCNKIKKHTMKNVDEYVVMLLVNELLEMIDHLHAVSVIHADIKADNILLMNKLSYPSKTRSMQLIDFGVSIDMKQFKSDQTFSYEHHDMSFKCVEMREHRPWTYQLDLYGLAGVIHVLLFGKYMDIDKKPSGIWMHKTRTPRYFNKNLWDNIFTALLNIRDCKSMPNLQKLRALLKEEIEEKENYVLKMVHEFNRALSY
ncbi:uncharacterized protein LOC106083570 [Stomoxys calcitrans]|uniref:uncharacterized protein LOC106083570 n=1 Tax=Stomoxys calcitrans TaxID=35570 RepID=UPI0027E2ABA3|nr:uncharacterized protein LOC106083570 [Stomoxys calcitrans]